MNTSDELEKLITMTEKVSETISDLNAKIGNMQTKLMLSKIGLIVLLGSVISFVTMNTEASYTIMAISVAAMLVSTYVAFYYYKKLHALLKLRHDETKILDTLFNMVYEYKDHLHEGELTAVELAIIDMKLKRMSFSAAV